VQGCRVYAAVSPVTSPAVGHHITFIAFRRLAACEESLDPRAGAPVSRGGRERRKNLGTVGAWVVNSA